MVIRTADSEQFRAPPLAPRPGLARWLFDRDLGYARAAEVLGVTYESVRRYCLPFSDPGRRIPPAATIEQIAHWTDGAVLGGHFYPELDFDIREVAA